MKFLVIISILGFLQAFEAVSENDTKLVLVQVAVRHGVRTVLRKYPNDINQAYWDSFGLGQLLPSGMKQLQDYGSFIMKRYDNFLNSSYHPSRVFARSTDYDRTLQSASAFLSGAFVPDRCQLWTGTPGQNSWLPIPVHTNDLQIDNMLHIDASCPRYDQLKDQVKASSYYLDREKMYQSIIDNLKTLSGLTDLDQFSVYDLADKFLIQEALGLPNEEYLKENSEKILEIDTFAYNYYTIDLEMAKLVSGGLLNDIISNMEAKAQTPASNRQFFLYTIHDSYIGGLQKLFNLSLTDYWRPDFASSYVFELRNDSRGDYYVKILYKNNKSNDPIHLTPTQIDGCEVLCPLEKFKALLKDGLVTDYKQICVAHPKTLYETAVYYFNCILSWFGSN